MKDQGLTQYGYHVLNPEHNMVPGKPTSTAMEVIQARNDGRIKTTKIPFASMEVIPQVLAGATVVPIAVITHIEDGKAGKYNGFIVGEELSGPKQNHPLILIPRGQIRKRT